MSKDDAFLRPATECIGLTLRPLTAGTKRQFSRCSDLLRDRLDALYGRKPVHDSECTENACNVQCKKLRRLLDAERWSVSLYLFIHSEDLALVTQSCWSSDLLFRSLDVFLNEYDDSQLDEAHPIIAAIFKAANSVRDYEVETNGEPPSPNSAGRDCLPATSAQSAA